MRVRALCRIGDPPLLLEGVRAILVEADDGPPLVVAGETGMTGVCYVAHCLDEDFAQVVSDMGWEGVRVESLEGLKKLGEAREAKKEPTLKGSIDL